MENLQPQVAWSNPCSWGREHTALNGILGYLMLSVLFSDLISVLFSDLNQPEKFVHFPLLILTELTKKLFPLVLSQKHPNLPPSHSPLTIISTCFPIFSSLKALIQAGFLLPSPACTTITSPTARGVTATLKVGFSTIIEAHSPALRQTNITT